MRSTCVLSRNFCKSSSAKAEIISIRRARRRSSSFSSVSFSSMARKSSAACTERTASTVKPATSARASGVANAAGTDSTSRAMGGWTTFTSKMEKKPQAMLLERQI